MNGNEFGVKVSGEQIYELLLEIRQKVDVLSVDNKKITEAVNDHEIRLRSVELYGSSQAQHADAALKGVRDSVKVLEIDSLKQDERITVIEKDLGNKNDMARKITFMVLGTMLTILSAIIIALVL